MRTRLQNGGSCIPHALSLLTHSSHFFSEWWLMLHASSLMTNTGHIFLIDMPTVAPGWPNVFNNNKVSSECIISGNLTADSSDEQLSDGKAATNIGMTFLL